MSEFPKEFNKESYVNWHNEVAEPSKNLITELESFVSELKTDHINRLKLLANLLDRVHAFQLVSMKTNREDVSDADTEILLADSLQSGNVDCLFKSVDSIIDKLWRKNKDRKPENYITTENIKEEIGDLIRSSVVTSSFTYAHKFAGSMKVWKDLVEVLSLDTESYADITSIETQEEAKMSNGYFAYHLDVKYNDGLRVEIQVYSKLSEIWRHLSHKLYEKVRIGGEVTWGHGSVASRLVSLGHLLHLAECEVQHLKSNIDN